MTVWNVSIWEDGGWRIFAHDLILTSAIALQQCLEYLDGYAACVHSKYGVPT